MYTAFFRSICQIGIFMVCAQAITHFRPNSSYEKYMKLLVSIMVLIQILQPMSRLFSGKGEMDIESRAWQLKEQFEQGMEASMEKMAESDKILENMTLLEVQETLKQQEEQEGQEGQDRSPKEAEAYRQPEEGYKQPQKEIGQGQQSQALGQIEKIEKIDKVEVSLFGQGGSHESFHERELEAVDERKGNG